MSRPKVLLPAFACLAFLSFALPATAASPLAGTWTLVAADVIRPDGMRAHDFGEAPKGMLIIDMQGHYSLQIYDSSRPKYASGDRNNGTADEYKANVLGVSAHFGTIEIDTTAHTLTLTSEAASFPNWEGRPQKRIYDMKGDELSYRVEPRPDGSVPISVWRRLK